MIKLARDLFPLITLPLCTVSSLAPMTVAIAQVTPDNTLGAENSVVTGDVINNIPSDRIDGGAIRGSNLFHSLQEFNVGEGRGAYFSNPAGIANILTRVTGGNPSNILGTLGVLGNANLFLINPKGIFFGPNARLNLGGSFFASTADSLLFDNNFEFSVTNPEAPPLLTVNIPIGLRFRDNPGDITTNRSVDSDGTVFGSYFQVQPAKTLALVGGNVNLDGAVVLAPGATVELGGLAQSGTVEINADGSLSFPNAVVRSDVSLINGAEVDVTGDGGSIAVNARNIDVLGGSTLYAGIGYDLSAVGSQAGNITLDATETIQVEGSFIANNIVNSRAVGKGGNINITAGSLEVRNGAYLDASTYGQGDAGSVTINAQGNVSFDGVGRNGFISGAYSTIEPQAVGNGGNINITAGSLDLKNGARLNASTSAQSAQGNAGSVTINVRDRVSFDGVGRNGGLPSSVLSNVEEKAIGNAGNINITAGSLEAKNGAQLESRSRGQGNAGSVTINTRDPVSFDGVSRNGWISGAYSTIESGAVGNGGDINITTGSLEMRNGAQVSAYTAGQGNAGNVNINARDTVSFDGFKTFGNGQCCIVSGVFSGVESAKAVGNGGDINITTRSFSASNGAGVIARVLGQGNGGNINIKAEQISLSSNALLQGDLDVTGKGRGANINLDVTGTILLTGGNTAETTAPTGESTRITLGVLQGGTGSAGDLKIKAGSLVFRDGAIIKDSTQGDGNAGNIQIDADIVDISGSVPRSGLPSGLFTSTDTTGKAADITVNTRIFRIADGAALSARTRGDGQGGNISVTTNSFEATGGGQLLTTTSGKGQAGDIFINATDLVTVSGSDSNYSNRIAKFPRPISPLVANDITETGATSGLFANTFGQGNAGSIKINANSLSLNNAQFNTSSNLENSQAGNLEVTTTKDIQLESGALISAQTQGGQGNIILNSRNLILRRKSNITTNATGTAAGGNITINTDNLVAFPKENSDITANAFRGSGGKITINTQGLFGMIPRTRTELEQILNTTDPTQLDPSKLLTSDITAISQQNPTLSGTVTINTPDIDPSQGLTELPENVTDPTQQIAENPCRQGSDSTFIVTGRGGLPSSPNQSFKSDNVRVDLVEPVASSGNFQSATNNQPINHTKTKRIIPAQGWVLNDKGEVVLTAYDPTATNLTQRASQKTAGCPVF